MIFVLHGLIAFCLIASAISTLRIAKWWVKGWDVSRVHLTWVMFILLILTIIFLPLNNLSTLFYLIGLTLAIIHHAIILFPYTIFHKTEIERADKSDFALKFMTVNVREKNKDYQNLIDLVNEVKPDLLLLTETNQAWLDKVLFLREQYDYTIFQPQENTYGMLFFSKYALKNSQIKFLVEDDVPSIHTNIEFKDKIIQFFGMHPRPPAPSNKSEHKDLELIKIAGITNENNLPTIVGGDLNDVGWSKITQTFKMISGLKDPRVGRGFYNTYNALIPIFRVPIDHFFLSKWLPNAPNTIAKKPKKPANRSAICCISLLKFHS